MSFPPFTGSWAFRTFMNDLENRENLHSSVHLGHCCYPHCQLWGTLERSGSGARGSLPRLEDSVLSFRVSPNHEPLKFTISLGATSNWGTAFHYSWEASLLPPSPASWTRYRVVFEHVCCPLLKRSTQDLATSLESGKNSEKLIFEITCYKSYLSQGLAMITQSKAGPPVTLSMPCSSCCGPRPLTWSVCAPIHWLLCAGCQELELLCSPESQVPWLYLG